MHPSASNSAVETPAAPSSDREVLEQIHALAAESHELLRSLVQMLLPKAEPRDGPSLEELLAALLASQRDQTVMLRQIGADLSALHRRLPGSDADPDSEAPIGRPNGRHHS